MHALLNRVGPSATDMIRADHTRVLATFHRYKASTSAATKRALVGHICLALEIHAQLEEEIFYPAMREVDAALVEKSYPEHEELKRRIAMLRDMEPEAPQYDQAFMELMRNVVHHVADEETALLPKAEALLGQARIRELGAQMTKRRLELSAPRAGEIAATSVRTMAPATMLVTAGAIVAGALLFRHATRSRLFGGRFKL